MNKNYTLTFGLYGAEIQEEMRGTLNQIAVVMVASLVARSVVFAAVSCGIVKHKGLGGTSTKFTKKTSEYKSGRERPHAET